MFIKVKKARDISKTRFRNSTTPVGQFIYENMNFFLFLTEFVFIPQKIRNPFKFMFHPKICWHAVSPVDLDVMVDSLVLHGATGIGNTDLALFLSVRSRLL